MTAEDPGTGKVIYLQSFTEAAAEALPPDGAPSYGKGGGDGGMEARIGRLEVVVGRMEVRLDGIEAILSDIKGTLVRIDARIDGMDGRLRGVETGLATLTERVAHLPSKGAVWGAVLTLVAALSAVFLLADRIQGFLGL